MRMAMFQQTLFTKTGRYRLYLPMFPVEQWFSSGGPLVSLWSLKKKKIPMLNTETSMIKSNLRRYTLALVAPPPFLKKFQDAIKNSLQLKSSKLI